MGRDKALLPFRGASLVEHVARAAAEAAGSVMLVGCPARYSHLSNPVVEDLAPGCGPLGGIHTALTVTGADWNLVVACDMPEVTGPFLSALLEAARSADADCLLPSSDSGRPEPLCAVYHRRCLPGITAALERGVRKVTAALAGLQVVGWNPPQPDSFRNVNTPRDWRSYLHG